MTRRRDRLDGWSDDPLVEALRAPGAPGELAGYDELAAEFRAHNPLRERRARRRLLGHVGTGMTTVVAALALSGGVAAAYSRALPAPLQSAAHSLLGPVGVPAADDEVRPHASPAPAVHPRPPRTSGPAPAAGQAAAAPAQTRPPKTATTTPSPTAAAQPPTASPTAAPSPAAAQPAPAAASPTAAPTPSPSPSAAPTPASLTARPGRVRLPAQQRVTVHGTLTTASGEPVAAHRVALQIRPAGQQAWQRVATGRTAGDGTIALRTPTLDRTTQVRLVTPQGLHSAATTLTVVPVVSVDLRRSDDGQHYVVTVRVLGAESGDTVALARRRADGSWVRVRDAQLPDAASVTWTVKVPPASERYRVRVVGTQLHADGYGWFTATP